MTWGVEGGKIDDKRLSRFGLICYGGSSNKKGMTWHVYNEDKSFDMELNQNDFLNIEEVYKKFKNDLRKQKLQNINDQ